MQARARTSAVDERRGDRVARGGQRGEVAFAELDDVPDEVASALRAPGAQPGEGVAVLMRTTRACGA